MVGPTVNVTEDGLTVTVDAAAGGLWVAQLATASETDTSASWSFMASP
jgi:hypothetical protein